MSADATPDPAAQEAKAKAKAAEDSSLGSFAREEAARGADKPTLPRPEHDTGVTPAAAGGAASLVGSEFDDLEVLAELGRGGMGVVYKARQKSLDRMVAVKMLRTEHLDNASIVSRFLSEARAAAALDHPGIVKIYQVGKSAQGQYFVMEYIDGQPLEAFIEKGPLPISGSAALMIRVAEAVHYAHGKGIIHRDLKPANIMINRFRLPVILDFGIVKFVGKASSMTQEGVVVGTPSYLPPEQAGEERGEVGPYSDVYSLGGILYTMLTGRVPFEGKTALDTLIKVIGQNPPTAVRELRPEVPEELERICMKCLEKSPGGRYPTAQALAEDLRRFRSRPKAAAAETSSIRGLPPVFLVLRETGKEIRLTGATTVIGRAPECDIVLKAAAVSKRHCQIHWQDGEAVVEDLDSSNGTWLNGYQVERCRLEDGDELEIGEHHFNVRIVRSKK
jgi:serine/threonine protein kinase